MRLKTLIAVGFLFIKAIISYSQEETIDHWETIIYAVDTFRYFPGTTNPGSDWKELTFDDSSWNRGPGGIGFGDNDDSTVIEDSILSLFLRKEFTITDTSKILYGVLDVDYDDAFVAYLNGTEIARSNIGTVGDNPTYDQAAASNHEALMYSGGLPESFNLSYNNLKSVIQPGKNVLSVQVHNITISSSDLSSIIYLSFGISDNTYDYRTVPAWFIPPVFTENFTSSNLPIIVINTENGVDIYDEPKVVAEMGIICDKNGGRNNLTDSFNEYLGFIGIETRGNVTQSFPKKSYGLETRDSLGENRNVSLFGFPEENDWILLACYLDKTMMRNSFASMMSQKMGRYASRMIFCELVLNGNYEGIYIFAEKIKWDDGRLNIDKLYPWTTSSDSVTGGYIYEVAQSGTDFGERRRYKYPGAEDVNTTQTNYIRDYDDNFRSVMELATYANTLTGYPVLIDVNSFIDEIIVQEACKNSDAYGWSSYFHKDRLRKLCAGPIWDFDQALANSTFNDGANTDEWLINKGLTDVPSFWPKLFSEAKFRYLLKKRWFELRENVLHTDSLIKFIDTTAIYLDEAQQRNFTRWPIIGTELWRSLPGWDTRDTYQKEVDYMKTFVINHLAWMDTQLEAVADRTFEIPELVISEIMYSAKEGKEYDFVEITNVSNKDIVLTGIFFSKGITYTFPNGEIIEPGQYKVIAANSAKFKSKYGFEPLGEYYGELDNAGERIEMQISMGCIVDAVRYNDKAPWPVIDDYNLGSLELVDLSSDNALPENWILSDRSYGSLGAGYGQSGTENSMMLSGVDIFPNPVVKEMNIRFSGPVTGKINIEIFDLLGNVQYSALYQNFSGIYIPVNLYNLNSGHYIVRITNDHATLSKQIVIVR